MATKKKTVKKSSKAVVKKSETGKNVALYDYGEDSGFEGTDREDYAIPFLGIVQDKSKWLSEVKGVKVGKLLNSVTKNFYDEVLIIPCFTQHVFVEWIPRKKGGGFVGIHEKSSDIVEEAKEASEEFGKYKVGENDLVETFYLYAVAKGSKDEEPFQCLIPFKSANIKIYKSMITTAKQLYDNLGTPLFAHLWKLSTKEESNQLGDFYNFRLELAADDAADCRLSPKDQDFIKAKSFMMFAKAGKAEGKIDHSVEETLDSGGDTETY